MSSVELPSLVVGSVLWKLELLQCCDFKSVQLTANLRNFSVVLQSGSSTVTLCTLL